MKLISGFFRVIMLFIALQVTAQSQDKPPADITIERDEIHLKGKFYVSEGTGVSPAVILLQGSPGNETDVLGIGKQLSLAGINALTFNYSGTLKSEGKTNHQNSENDIMAAYKFLHDPVNIKRFKIDTASIILGGWSYGGGMAMTYAIKHPEITNVFTIAGVDWGAYFEEYIRNPEFKKTTDANMTKMASLTEQIRFEKGAMPDEITKDGIIMLDSAYFLRKSAAKLVNKNILIICGWDDVQATVDNYILPFYSALKREKAEKVEIIAFQDGHYFSKSRAELAAAIIKWVKAVPERKK
ncbi:MAG: alpha/beta fold hydrolase [Bacteroidetes bacterium]|nr:MAG: alpha/beta fold hydrolase [Bacteroidota bacterium]